MNEDINIRVLLLPPPGNDNVWEKSVIAILSHCGSVIVEVAGFHCVTGTVTLFDKAFSHSDRFDYQEPPRPIIFGCTLLRLRKLYE